MDSVELGHIAGDDDEDLTRRRGAVAELQRRAGITGPVQSECQSTRAGTSQGVAKQDNNDNGYGKDK